MEVDEFFYGATLDKAGAVTEWNINGERDDDHNPIYKLHIKQILLGHTAKPDEYNVVEVETMSLNEVLKIPIAVLKVGENRSVLTHLEFPDAPVTFKLIEGSGPVYIHGNQTPVIYGEPVPEEMHDEAVEEEEEEEEPPSKKLKGSENGSKALSKGNGQKNNKKHH